MNNTSSIQVVNHHRQHLYEELQEVVLAHAEVNCRIMVTADLISVRTKDWPDYYLAKAIIKQRTEKEVVRDTEVL